MTGQISDAKINEVRDRSDIVELVSQYVSLKRSGTNFMGLCPFHAEKSPSFSVNSGRQFFYCFGCGVGGDVFAFLMKMEGLSFPDAVRSLAGRIGIELEERVLSAAEIRRQEQRERLFRINDLAADYFHRLLMEHPAGEAARRYMRKRGYGRKAAAEYRIGYAPAAWNDLGRHLAEQGISGEDIQILGLTRVGRREQKDYDLFRDRLMFPILDLSGRVVAFAGRVLDDGKPKYINSPESPIYHKGQILFGLSQARQEMRRRDEAILVEGYFDQLALFRAGFSYVAATCGTALSIDHAQLLKRYARQVLLLFDQDNAGRQATFKAMSILQQEGLTTKVVELSRGEDPDSYLRRYGVEAFAERLAAARPVMEVFIEDLLSGVTTIEDRVRAAEKALRRIMALPSALEQDLYLKTLAERSGIGLEGLREESRRFLAGRHKDAAPRLGRSPVDDARSLFPEQHSDLGRNLSAASGREAQSQGWGRTEELLLCLLLSSHELQQEFTAVGGPGLLPHADAVALAGVILDHRQLFEMDSRPLFDSLDPHRAGLLKRLYERGLEPFGENRQAIFADCLDALARDRARRRREDLLRQIREAEKSGELEQKKALLEEFNRLR